MLTILAISLIVIILITLKASILTCIFIKAMLQFIVANYILIYIVLKNNTYAECMYTEKKPSPGHNSDEGIHNSHHSIINNTHNITVQPDAYQAYTNTQATATYMEIQAAVTIAQNPTSPANQLVGGALVIAAEKIKESSKYPTEEEAKDYLNYEEEKENN